MAKRKQDGVPEEGRPDGSEGTETTRAPFPIEEHIGRTLKALFDEVTAQPLPEKLRKLLDELERKEPDDS